MLEVIDVGPGSPSHPTPLLFVHGAWHGAWCWDEHFLRFFADRGFRAVAVSLRGHGRSLTTKPLHTCSIADFVADVDFVADHLPLSPVLIGHSMGGLVVQKYLESRSAPAGVLLASTPPRGIFGSWIRGMRRHPWMMTRVAITGRSLRSVNTPQLAHEALLRRDSRITRRAVRRAARGRERTGNA